MSMAFTKLNIFEGPTVKNCEGCPQSAQCVWDITKSLEKV